MSERLLTRDELRSILHYDDVTGIFTWKERKGSGHRKCLFGKQTGYLKPSGYLLIGIHGRLFPAHRLAWLYIYGEWPPKQIDHINGIRSDNRIVNLRKATGRQNNWNASRTKHNRTGFKGVGFDPRRNKWRARIKLNGKPIFLGQFKTPAEAQAAYAAAAVRHFGAFARLE